jgi:4-amino-4-deoxy-L-arabinose transferase-like glycosyltransferase
MMQLGRGTGRNGMLESAASSTSETRRSARVSHLAALVLIVLVGVALRTYGLDALSAWNDETLSLQHLHAPDLMTFLLLEHADEPLVVSAYFVIEYLWSRLAGTSELSIRLLSVIFATLTLLLIYLFGRDMYGAQAGIIAALCLALHPAHIIFSQQIRMYSLVVLLALCSAFSFVKVVHQQQTRWWVVHIAANTLLVWTHVFATPLLLAEGLFLLAFRWREYRRMCLWIAIHVLMLIPLVVWATTLDSAMIDGNMSFLPLPTIRISGAARDLSVEKLWFYCILGSARRGFTQAFARTAPWFKHGLSFGFLLCIAWLGWRARQAALGDQAGCCIPGQESLKNHSMGETEKFAFLMALMLGPPVALLVLSYIWVPCFRGRYMLYTLLPMCVIAGGAIGHIRRSTVKTLAGCALLILCGYHAIAHTLSRPVTADWKSVMTLVPPTSQNDMVLLHANYDRSLELRYNLKRAGHGMPVRYAITLADLRNQTAHLLGEQRDLWVMIMAQTKYDVNDASAFEAFLSSHDLTYSVTRVDSLYTRLFVYRIVQASELGS